MRLPLASLLLLAAAACGDLKSSTPNDGTDGGSNVEPSTTGSNGAGPLGALPSGYCCTDDTQCRFRHCATTAGGKMCLDECYGAGACGRTEAAFQCDGTGRGSDTPDHCQPPAGFTCLDPNKYDRGTRASGECCDGLNVSDNGDECQGGRCISVNQGGMPDNPYVCSQACSSTKDCPSGMICGALNACEPGNSQYTCK